MKTTNILYWVFNGLFFVLMFGSAIPDIISMPDAVAGIHGKLGYPIYFIPFIGVAKALGAIVILLPGLSRLKEWAYAGLVFDLVGAAYSLAMIPNPDGPWYFMFLPLSLAALAYIFYVRRSRMIAARTRV